MELGIDFDDSFFTGKVRQKQTLTSYNAKVCYPEWFLSDQADNGRNDMATVYKFRGDYHYQRKDIESAIQCYNNSLDNLGAHNRTMRRELMESLARCNMQAGQYGNAQQYTECVMNDCLTIEHYCQVLLLQQQLYKCSGDLMREGIVLHQLINIHPDNSQFWLKLTEVYEKIRNCLSASSAYTKSNTTCTKCMDQNIGNRHETENKCETGSNYQPPESLKEGLTACMCAPDAGNRVLKQECSGLAEGRDKDSDQCTVETKHKADLKTVEEQSRSRGKFSELLTDYPVDLILLTCYVRTRSKLLSVQGTVGSFIKDKNIQHVKMIDEKIQGLSKDEGIMDHVTQFVRRDIIEDDTDDEESKPDRNQDIKAIMENKITSEDFNNRWFSWVKEVS